MTRKRNKARDAGFTILELLVAVSIFVIVAGVALTLVARNEPLYNRQQNTTALNIALRSSIAQMEQDMVNAGTGYYVGASFPDWPVGVTIINNSSDDCYDDVAQTYGPNCFDKINIISTDLGTTPGILADDVVSSSAVDTTFAVHVPDSDNPATGDPWTAEDFADQFAQGSQILLLKADGSRLTTLQLAADATVLDDTAPDERIELTYTPTNPGGTNGDPTAAGADGVTCTQTDPAVTLTNDPLDITRCWNDKLGDAFDVDSDYVLKLAAVTYKVDASDSTNPKLVRQVQPGGAEEVVADQVIGFKIGAGLWNNINGCANYHFNAANYPHEDDECDADPPTLTDPYNFTRVRSVRISLIGRTVPVTDPTYTFRNTFDGGAYQIQAVSAVVNPRNLSMRDQ
jgi:prepilin-type N-terminal cleavage/methylation domain-containing protein